MISTDPVLLERSLTRASFWDFVQVFWDDVPGAATPVYSWHMEFLAQELQIVAERVFARQPRDYNLIVNISPGTSKSTLCSILFPCWVWTRMIKAKIIAASHTESLARDLATKSRAVLCSEHYRTVFPEVTLQEDREAKLDYANTRGGERCAFTVGGKSPMGRHGDIQIVDDPIDPKRAVSELELQEAEKFFTQVLPSRVTNKANSALILVMQRLHEADPTGVLLSKAKADGGAPVRHLCLPAELTGDIRPAELRPRYEAAGGLMDPARLPANVLREFQVTLGQYGYAGQFLQSPVPPGGGMFQISYFNQRCAAAPYKAKRVRYWDKSYTANETSCYTAGVLLALAEDGGFFVEDCVHGQWNPAERDDIILATAYKDRLRYGPKYAPQIWIEQEPAAGIDSFRFLAKKLAGFPVFADKVSRNKEIRAQPWSSQCAARNIYLVEGGWDINGWIDEHIHFPLGRLKDRVDASGGAFTKLAGRTSSGKLTTYTFQGGKKKVIRILLVERAKLSEVVITEHTTLLINLNDPPLKEVMSTEGLPQMQAAGILGDGPLLSVTAGVGVGESGVVNADPAAPPAPHGLSKLLAHLELDFADLQPSECQAHWDEPDERFGKKPEEIIFDRSRGKRLWTFLIRNRGADVFVLVDDGDRRALSLAYALCDVLNLPRGQTLCRYGDESWKAEPKEVAPNPHVFQMVKECRNLVVG